MVSDEEVLEKLNDEYNTDEDVAKLMAELNLDEELNFPTESDTEISEEEEDTFPEFNEEDLSVPDEFKADESDLETSDESMDEIPSEEILDMDEIDAILSDVSDIHPERKVSAEELEERIAKYEENPEAAEEALLQGNEEETSGEDAGSSENSGVSESEEAESSSDTESASSMDEDFLMNLENVDEMLADVENKANEESERLKAEREAAEGDSDLDEINDILHKSDNNEAVNDELLSMIAGIDKEDDNEPEGMFDEEGDGEEDDKKKKKAKKDKKKKKKKGKEGIK